jgi:hypothetical protein
MASKKKHATPDWRTALAQFDLPPERAEELLDEENEDVLADFTTAVLDSPWGVGSDWKEAVLNPVEHFAEVLPRVGITLALEVDEERVQMRVRADGEVVWYTRPVAEDREDDSFRDVLFALERVLPKRVAIYSLVETEQDDTAGHAILPVERWRKVREALGPTFARLFCKHEPLGPPFRRSRRKGDVAWDKFVAGQLAIRKAWLAEEKTKQELTNRLQEVMDVVEGRKGPQPWLAKALGREPERAERLHQLPNVLERIAYYHGVAGGVLVLNGDEGGWAQLHLSVLYRWWQARLALWWFLGPLAGKGTLNALPENDWANLFTQALAVGELGIAEWCGERISNNPRAFRYRGGCPSRPFLVRLYALWKGTSPQGVRELVEPAHCEVLRCWRDEAGLADALAASCDYHIRQAWHAAGGDFRGFPESVFPADVLAILRVRQELRLATPEVSHPLMETPLARVPVPLPRVPDDVLDRVVTAVEEELPGW